MIESPILTVHDVSETLKKSEKWVYSHAVDLGGSRIGRSWFFTQMGVQHAIERGKDLARDSQNQREAREPEIRLYPKKGRQGLGRRGEKAVQETSLVKRAGLADYL